MVSALAGSLGSRNAPAASACSATQVVPTGASSTSRTVTCAAETVSEVTVLPAGGSLLGLAAGVPDLVVTERLRARVPGPVDSHAARVTANGASHARKR